MKLIILIFFISVVHSTNLVKPEVKKGKWGLTLDRPELCCNSVKHKGPFSSTFECCSDLVFNSAYERCCNGTIMKSEKKLEENEDCCGQSIINRDKMWCCGSKPFNKRPLQTCCGDQLYSVRSHVCCYGVILPLPQYTSWNCCSTATYDTRFQMCIDGKILDIVKGTKPFQCGEQLINYYTHMCCNNQAVPRKDNFTLCCENKPFQSDQQICCNDVIFKDDKAAFYQCCGNELININTQRCCGGLPVLIPQTGNCANFNCCGEKLYDTEQASCCNGALHPTKKTNVNCCAQSTYDVETQICCKDTIYNKGVYNISEDYCCEADIYNPKEQVCCAKSIYPIDKVPPNICCSDLRSYSVFLPVKKSP